MALRKPIITLNGQLQELPDGDAVAVSDVLVSWTVADEAERLALSVTSSDITKVAWQQDNDSFWVLKDETPTWVQLNGAGGGAANIDGGFPASTYGGTELIDGGTP